MQRVGGLVGAVLLIAAVVAVSTAVQIWSDNRLEAMATDREADAVEEGSAPNEFGRTQDLRNEANHLRDRSMTALMIGGFIAVAFVISGTVVLVHAAKEEREYLPQAGSRQG